MQNSQNLFAEKIQNPQNLYCIFLHNSHNPEGTPDIDYFIYGHRHIELDLMLSRKSRMMIIGDWIWQFTYVVWDGEHLLLEEYVEGESQL